MRFALMYGGFPLRAPADEGAPAAKPGALTTPTLETGYSPSEGHGTEVHTTKAGEGYKPTDRRPASEEGGEEENADDGEGDARDEGEEDSEEKEGGEEAGEKEETGEAPEDLGEYDPATVTEETVAKFDKAYQREDGTPGKLNEGTYNYLADRYGVTRADVEAIERGQVAAGQQLRQAWDSRATKAFGAEGASPVYLESAIAWAAGDAGAKKAPGLTEAQTKRFNDAMASGDLDRQEEAIDLLMGRFKAANPDFKPAAVEEAPGKQGRRRDRLRRPVNPDRSVGQEGSGGGGEGAAGFKDRTEWQAALREAGADQTKINAANKKLKASPWWRASRQNQR